ncbi:MAG: hypothetical protein GQ534_09785 [Candidatus Delongbacteria bacterium]|nr:hypothetical protein [Candidatus Delongbacteria bacterium]
MKFKVLHIASFIGNIGDNANHEGFRKKLKEYIGYDFIFTEMEIRDFYFNTGKRSFDSDFIDEANKYDLVIFGGGNFFEISFPRSKTGTTFDIDLDVLKNIKTKIFFNGVGFDPSKGAAVIEINKFESLIDFIATDDRFFVTFRNDGSIIDFKKIYSKKKYTINVVPDGGFFYKPKDTPSSILDDSRKYISINIAGDMLNLRFNEKLNSISFNKFVDAFSEMLNIFLESYMDYDIIFTAHIFKDFYAINEILNSLNDMMVRKRVRVAPYIQGKGFGQIFNIYKNSELVIANRFHANVCSIGMNIPTIGINNYPKIRKMYNEINLNERVIDVTNANFADKLLSEIISSIKSKTEIVKKYEKVNKVLENDIFKIYSELKKWIQL